MRFGSFLTQVMYAAVDIGVQMEIGVLNFFDHTRWFLGCSAVIEINERFVVYDFV